MRSILFSPSPSEALCDSALRSFVSILKRWTFSLFITTLCLPAWLSSLDSSSATISFIVIDLKYNRTQGVKICEMQSLASSVLKLNPAAAQEIADQLFALMNQYWEPSHCFFVNNLDDEGLVNAALAWKWHRRMMSSRWHPKSGYSVALFDEPHRPLSEPIISSALADYEGAIFLPWRLRGAIRQIQQLYPTHLIIDELITPWFVNKGLIHLLFTAHEPTLALRPLTELYYSDYQEGDAEQLLRAIPRSYLVLKPLVGTRGEGVIIFPQEKLPSLLHHLFSGSYATQMESRLRQSPPCQSERDFEGAPLFLTTAMAAWMFPAGVKRHLSSFDYPYSPKTRCEYFTSWEEGYSYWRKLSQPEWLLLEEFISSDPLAIPFEQQERVQVGWFDPTMRVVAALLHDQGATSCHCLGKYWKCPNYTIEQRGSSLTQRHKSDSHHLNTPPVDEATWQAVKQQLENTLPLLYEPCLLAAERAPLYIKGPIRLMVR